mgnify:CR=1 FL=1
MKLLYTFIILFAFSFAEERWEYLLCEFYNTIPEKNSTQKSGFKVLTDDKSKYNNLYGYEDLVPDTLTLKSGMQIFGLDYPNELQSSDILSYSLNLMGIDGWELVQVQGKMYYFKRKVLKPVTKPLKKK